MNYKKTCACGKCNQESGYFSNDKISWKDHVSPEFDDLDRYFPKGDKRRGDALVVNAVAYFQGNKEEIEAIEEDYYSLWRFL